MEVSINISKEGAHCAVGLNFLKNSPRENHVLCYNSYAKAAMEISEASSMQCRLKEAAGSMQSSLERESAWTVTSTSIGCTCHNF